MVKKIYQFWIHFIDYLFILFKDCLLIYGKLPHYLDIEQDDYIHQDINRLQYINHHILPLLKQQSYHHDVNQLYMLTSLLLHYE